MPIEVKKYDNNGNELAISFGLGAIKAVGVGMIEEMVQNRDKNGEFKDIYDFAARAGSKVINKKSLEALSKSGSLDKIHQNRNQIVESVEILCKFCAAKQEEKNSNQMSLFGAAQIKEELPVLKQIKEWNKQEKLQEEFKAFGFFLNEHPIDDSLDDLQKRGVISSKQLDQLNDGNIVKLAGVVAYSKHKSGPRGRYAYLTLSDPFGIYETAIFDEDLITQHRDAMEDGNSLVVECLARKDQGGLRLLVKSIEKLADFIKRVTPRKEAYQDIKQQERKNFDWKKKNQDQDRNSDIVALQMAHNRKIEQLRAKKIVKKADFKISNRDDILKLKSFLSQRMAPEEFEEFTRVSFVVKGDDGKDVRIDLDGKYLLDDGDLKKIGDVVDVLKI